MISLSISHRVGQEGKWKPIDLSQYLTADGLATAMLQMDGFETVAKWENDGAKAMACGHETQKKAYRDKGYTVMTFSALVQGLRSKDYLERLVAEWSHPLIQEAAKVFEAPVSQTDLLESREERMAIMTVDGKCSEEEAAKYCDKHPELFGEIRGHKRSNK